MRTFSQINVISKHEREKRKQFVIFHGRKMLITQNAKNIIISFNRSDNKLREPANSLYSKFKIVLFI